MEKKIKISIHILLGSADWFRWSQQITQELWYVVAAVISKAFDFLYDRGKRSINKDNREP